MREIRSRQNNSFRYFKTQVRIYGQTNLMSVMLLKLLPLSAKVPVQIYKLLIVSVVVFQKLAQNLNLVTFLIVMKLVFIIVHYQTGHFPLKVYLLKVLRTLKERSTIMLACSATGEKLKPLVISKALTPRCVRGICNFCIDIRQNPINHMAIL